MNEFFDLLVEVIWDFRNRFRIWYFAVFGLFSGAEEDFLLDESSCFFRNIQVIVH
jgi:hypothetical protein